MSTSTENRGPGGGQPNGEKDAPPLSFAERRARGRSARENAPRASHADWTPAADRPDPVALLEEQGVSRVQELLPIRHGRMAVSPFTFYRGAALIMAADLATTPVSGITAQICGDAHLSNFGVFGTPERTMIFDLNDFDETLPGPWEWDLKRLAVSFEIAGRQRQFSGSERRAATIAVARSYREQMLNAADAPVLQAWYDRADVDRILKWIREERRANRVGKRQVQRADAGIAKAMTKDSMSAFAKLVGVVDGQLRILAVPPLIEPVEDLFPDHLLREPRERIMQGLIEGYPETLLHDHHPIREFRFVHMARKVVGVGSVGTRAWVLLLTGRDDGDPLLLQAKEAQASVLERFLGKSAYSNHGQRVVLGQRLMQSASDIFLGWQQVVGVDGETRDFYVRQFHDWKGSIDTDELVPQGAELYARLCGQTLARAHSRSGDRMAIAGYLGRSARFDQAISEFSEAYADQNERDYAAFVEAISSGRLEALSGL